jgi:VCBS repeat-containing protein
VTHFFNLTPGTDNLTGLPDDYNAFQLTPSTLQSVDTVTGGAAGSFYDVLVVTAAGTILGSQFSGVTNVEQFNLFSGGNNVTLTNGLVAGSSLGFFAILDGGGNDTVDASAVSTTPMVFYAAGGSDTLKGGGGNDAIVIAAANLTSADTIQGGAGIDNLYFSTAGTVAASAFTNVSGIEGIGLSSLGNSVTLTNAMVASSNNGGFAVADGAGDDTVDASGITNGTAISFFASSGGDTFRGGNGPNGYVFTATDLTSADTVTGSAGSADNLFISTAGTLSAAAFTNVTGIEGLVLANGTNDVTLTNGLVAGTAAGYFAVVGGTGNDTVNASGVTNGTSIAFYGTNGGNDAFTGGNGNDSFLFGAGQLTSADTVVGGGGNDTLWMTTAGTTSAAALANVTGIEGVFLQAGGTFNLANGITGAATFAAVGSSAVDTFDASAVTGYKVTFTGNGGADVLRGGSQDDTFFIADSAFASINGNGGIDRITLTAASQSFNLTANAAKISNLEVIDLSSSLNSTLTLAGTDIALINASGTSLYVIGDVDDTVNAGNGYTQIASGVVNNAVAPGRTFFEYQHSSGSLLFIDSAITAQTATTGNGSASVPEGTAAGATVFNAQQSGATSYVLGGADAALFSIDGTGHISFNASPNFEAPQDQGHNSVYDLTVTSSNGTATPNFVENVAITVTDVAPSAPIDGNVALNSVIEGAANGTAVGITAVSTDPNGPAATFSLTDNAGGRFAINAITGDVSVANGAAIDFETAPGHAYSITVQALAGSSTSTQSFSIGVSNVNEAPVNGVPGARSVNEDTHLVFTGANAITISDVDASGGNETVTLSVASGALTLNGTAGLVFTVGNGTSNSTMTFSGTVAAINAALNGLSYLGNLNFNGSDTLHITTNDNGNSGSGGAQSDADSVAITVIAVNDTPSFTVGANQTVAEDAGAQTVPGFATAISPGPADEAGQTVNFITSNNNNALFLVQPTIDASGNLTYTAAADANGSATVMVQIHDNGGGADTSVAQTFAINVDAVNDVPTLTATGNNFNYAPGVDLFSGPTASTGPANESTQLLDKLVLTITNVAGTPGEDSLTIDTTPVDLTDHSETTLGPLGVDVLVAFDIGTATATVTITRAPGLTAANIVSLVDGLTYTDTTVLAGEATRVVTLTSLQDDGGTTPGVDTATLNITSNVNFNTAPVATDDAISATEKSGLNNAVVGNDPTGNVITDADPVADSDAEDANTALRVTSFGTLDVGNPDNGTVGGAALAGQYGSLTIDQFGAYHYTVDQANTTVQGLHTFADTVEDVFHYRVEDTGTLFDDAKITITVHGADDLAQAVADTGIMTEDTGPTQFPVRSNDTLDPDSTALNTVAPGSVTVSSAVVGTSFLNTDATAAAADSDHQIEVTLHAAFQQLHAGETATVTVPYTLTGDAGNDSTVNLVVTVNGANDTPTAVDDTGTMTEDQSGTAFTVLTGPGADTLDPDHGAPNSVSYDPGTHPLTIVDFPAGTGIDASDVNVTVNPSNQVVVSFVGTDFQNMKQGEVAHIDIPYTLHGDQPGDTSLATLHVTVNGVNDAPTGAQDFLFNLITPADDAIGNTSLVLDDTSVAGAPDPAGPQKTINGSLLAGATDIDGPSAPATVAVTDQVTAHGHVTINTSGEFSYMPNPGYLGTDTFTYTITDGNTPTAGTDTGSVTVNVAAPKVWYVNADAAIDGDGTSDNPFKDFSHLNGAGDVDGAGDTIFLYNATNHYTGGLTLENNQKLIGENQGLTVNGTPLVGTALTNNAIIDGGVVLGQSDTISGVTLGNTGVGGTALSGTGFVTLNIDHTVVNTNNNGMTLTNGAFGAGASFTSFTSSGATDVSLTNVTGSVDLGTGAMNGLFAVNGGTVSTTYSGNLSQANAADMVNVSGGHSGTLTFQTGTLHATNGDGLQFTNADGTYNFNGTTTLNGDNAGVDIFNGSAGTFTFGSNTSITSPIGNAFELQNSTANVTYSGNITQASNAATVNVLNETGGTVTFQSGTLNATNGTGLQFNNADNTFNFNGTTTLHGGNAGVDILNGSSGTFTFGLGTAITSPTGTAFNANASSANVTYDGTITQSNAATAVSVASNTGGTIDINGLVTANTSTAAAVSLTNNTGATVQFDGGLNIDTTTGTGFTALGGGTVRVLSTAADESINSTGAQALNLTGVTIGTNGFNLDSTTSGGGASGVHLQGVSGNTIALGTGSLSGSSGDEFLVGDGGPTANAGGTAAITYGGSISSTGANRAVDIQDRASGAGDITLSGNITQTAGTASGIFLDDNAAGNVTFSGTTNTLASTTANALSITDQTGGTVTFSNALGITTSSGTGVHLATNTGSTVTFSGGGSGLDIGTTSGTGFDATGGGTINVAGSGNTIATTTGKIISADSVSVGASGVAFTTLGSTGTVAGDAISLNNVDGSGNTFNGGTVTVAGTSGVGSDGIAITGGSAATFAFSSATISGATGAGVNISGANGAVTISGGAIGAAANGIGVAIGAGSGDVSIASTVTKTTAGDVVDVGGRTSGTVTLSGNLSATGGVDNGIDVHGNTGGIINFSGTTKTLNTGANTAVDLSSNTGATVNFSGGGLDIDTTSGTGFSATGGGTVSVTGTGNSINSTSGTALNISNTTIGGSDVTFQSITSGTGANSSATGIILDTTGAAGGLHVDGNGSAGTGGTIQHKTGADGSTTSGIGIYLNNTADVQLNWMQLNNLSNYGIRGLLVNGFTLDHSVIDAGAAGNTNGSTTALDEASISFGKLGPGAINGLTGTASITNTTIADGYEDNLSVFNNSGTLNLTLSSDIIRDTGGGLGVGSNQGNDGVVVRGLGTATINVDVKNSQFIANRGDHFNATADDSAVLNAQFGNNGGNTLTGGAPDPLGGGIAIQAGVAWAGSGSVNIANNSINNSTDTPININIGGTGTFNAKVDGNTIGTSGVAGSGTTGNKDAIRIVANGDASVDATPDGGTLTAAVRNNIIQQVSGNGIFAIARDGGTGGDPIELNLTITGNTLREPAPGNNAIRVEAGATSTDDVRVRADIGGAGAAANIIHGDWGVPVGADEIRLRHQFSGLSEFFLTGLGADTSNVATVAAYLAGRNTLDGGLTTSATIAGGGVYKTGGTPPLPPLLAADGGVQASSPTPGETHLTQAQLDSVVAAAISQWAHAGASAAQLAALSAITFSVADLSDKTVGEQSPGHIFIDVDAAGHGWFVDPTPNDNSEFTHAANAAGTDLYTDPSNDAAGHLDLLTAVTHEMGHELGLADSTAASDVHDLMHIDLVDGERRLPDATDVAQANGTSAAQAAEAALPLSARAAAGTPIVVGTAGNDSIDAGHGGNVLFGGAGADTFVFGPSIPLNAPTPAQVTHVADYSAAHGDSFDFSAITSAFHNSGVSDSLVVRAVEDASGKFATLQADHIDPMGLPSAPNWVNVAQLDGAHAGDSVNILIDNNHSVHLAQIHVDLLV